MKLKKADDSDGRSYRKKISALTDYAVSELWGYCRTNKHSLNSEVVCKYIRRAIDVATEGADKVVEEAVDDAKVASASEIKWRREMRSIKASLKSTQRNYQKLLKENLRLTETIQIQQEVIKSDGVDKHGYENST